MPRVFLVKKSWATSSSTEQDVDHVSSSGHLSEDLVHESEKVPMEVESLRYEDAAYRRPAFHLENDGLAPRFTAVKQEPVIPHKELSSAENMAYHLKHRVLPTDKYFTSHTLPHFGAHSLHMPMFGGARDRHMIDPMFYPLPRDLPRDPYFTRTLTGCPAASRDLPLMNGCHNGYLRNEAGKICFHHSAFKPASSNIGSSLELLYTWARRSDASRLKEESRLKNEKIKHEQRQRDLKQFEEARIQDEKRRNREQLNASKSSYRAGRDAENTSTQWEKIKFLNDTMADISRYFNFEKVKDTAKEKVVFTESEHLRKSVDIIRENNNGVYYNGTGEESKSQLTLKNNISSEIDTKQSTEQGEKRCSDSIDINFEVKRIKTEVISDEEELDYMKPQPHYCADKDMFGSSRVSVKLDGTSSLYQDREEQNDGRLFVVTKQEPQEDIESCAQNDQQSITKLVKQEINESGVFVEQNDGEESDSKTDLKPNPLLKYKCEECGKAFSRSTTLVTHQRIHSGDKPFVCGECGRAFRQPGNLTRHRLTHTSLKPHVCSQCGKAFNRASNLQTHMRTHTNDKPFHCDFCGKGFNQKIDMKIHRYIHTGEKPHRCQKCGRGFKQLTHLTYHMRTHSDVRMYHCQYCDKGFNQKGNLQAHIYGHTGERPFKCDVCGKGFTLTSTLNTHKRIHAPKKPFQCKFCDKAFYQKNALKTHYISSHPCIEGESIL